MHIYLLRHGIAEDAGPGMSDGERKLTESGIARLRLQGLALKQSGLRVDVLRSSPLVRSLQTATILAEALGVAVEKDARLAPGCRLADLQDVLHEHRPSSHVMIVGHQPDLGEIVRSLTGASVKMRKGTLADVRIHAPGSPLGQLCGLYDPEVLAALGAGAQ